MPGGQKIEILTLKNKKGMEVSLSSFGATVVNCYEATTDKATVINLRGWNNPC